MEKATSGLELVDLSKQNFRRTLDSLQEGAHSLLLLSVQWKEIESYFDSTKNNLREQEKELKALEESIKVRALELEKKERELQLEQEAESEKRKEEVEQMERFTKSTESKEKELELKLKEVERYKEEISAKEKLRGEFDPLVSLLAKSIGSSATTMPTSCSTFYLNENASDLADDLVKRNTSLARMFPYLDPAKLVLDAIQGSFKEYLNKGFGETDERFDRVVDSCIMLLEKLIQMRLIITPKVKQEATQLGIEWIGKAKTNQSNSSRGLGCLLFLAAYGLASVTTREVLLTLLERFLLYDQAPTLFRILGLEDKVFGVIEILKKKEEYFAAIKFICEFRLSKLTPGTLLLESLNSLEKTGSGISMEAQKAKRDKRKADAVMTLEYVKEKKLESWFPLKALRKRIAGLERNESPEGAMTPVGQSETNPAENSVAGSIIPSGRKKAKRQRLNEPINHTLNSPVNRLGSVSIACGEKAEESKVIHQEEAKATNPLSTESKPKILSGSISADMLRELLEKHPLEESDLSNALKCTPDPAKLVVDTSMALCPTNAEGVYEFKLLITSASCSLLLDQLKKLSPQIGNPLKGDTKKLAVYWKDKLSKSKTDKLEVVCFLHFLGIFRIASEFKANDLLGLLDNASWRTVSPDLCQFLGLVDAIPGFIRNLIKTGHRLKAIDYIYSFEMVQRYPVSAILNDFLRITKEAAEKSFRDANNESAPQVAAIDKQIKAVRAAIRCISCRKLESEFQIGDLKEQIKSLMKRRKDISDGSKPGVTTKESLAEVGSVTSNTTLEPEAASPSVSNTCSTKKNKRGEERGNNQRSVHVASHSSNRIPGHDSLHQRLTWPVDQYGRSFTGTSNSDYNYNHWTQPQGSHFYQLYQHNNPYYRNCL